MLSPTLGLIGNRVGRPSITTGIRTSWSARRSDAARAGTKADRIPPASSAASHLAASTGAGGFRPFSILDR